MTTGSRGDAIPEQVSSDRLLVLSRDIAAQFDGRASIARAVDLASKVVDCSLADVVQVRSSGSLELLVSSDPARSGELVRLSDAAGVSPAGFCRSATGSANGSAVVSDLTVDDRWPGYARAVRETMGLRAEMAIGLDVTDETCLVLRFFAEQPDPWSEGDRRDATVFAGLAALAVDRAALRNTAANLRRALDSNRRIGTAIGILMGRRRVTEDAAFELLRVASQHSNRRLRSIAEDVVLTGDLPEAAGGAA